MKTKKKRSLHEALVEWNGALPSAWWLQAEFCLSPTQAADALEAAQMERDDRMKTQEDGR